MAPKSLIKSIKIGNYVAGKLVYLFIYTDANKSKNKIKLKLIKFLLLCFKIYKNFEKQILALLFL